MTGRQPESVHWNRPWILVLLLVVVWTGSTIIFWRMQTRYAEHLHDTIVSESQGLLGPVIWATQRYALTAKEGLYEFTDRNEAALTALVSTPSPALVSTLSADFRDWLEHHSNFVSVALIDGNGQELLRIDRQGSGLVAAGPSQLKNRIMAPGISDALAAPAGLPLRAEVALCDEHGATQQAPFPVSRLIIPLGERPKDRLLVTAEIDARPIIDFMLDSASDPPNRELWAVRIDGVVVEGDRELKDIEFSDQRLQRPVVVRDVLPALWRAIEIDGGSGAFTDERGIYVYQPMISPDARANLRPLSQATGIQPLQSSVAVVFHPTQAVNGQNVFRGRAAWAALFAIYALSTGLAIAYRRSVNQARELKSLSDAQQHALGVVNYELRTPAAALDMMLESDERGEARWQQLASASKHLLSVLDELNFSSPDELLSNARRGVSTLENLVNELDRQMTPLLASRRVELSHELPSWTQEPIGGYLTILRICLSNLIRYSAVRTTSNVIEVSYGWLDDAHGISRLRCRVGTQAARIANQELDRIFVPYGDERRRGRVSGKSLFTLKQVLEALGGSATVDYTAASTLEFNVELPISHVDSEPAPMTEEVSLRGLDVRAVLPGHTALLVEDDRLLGPLFMEFLAGHFGLSVTLCARGDEALQQLEVTRFDLLIVDDYMPGMSGIELIKAVRRLDAAIPMLGMTAGQDSVPAEQLRKAGADLVLIKPLTVEQFTQAIIALEQKGRLSFLKRHQSASEDPGNTP